MRISLLPRPYSLFTVGLTCKSNSTFDTFFIIQLIHTYSSWLGWREQIPFLAKLGYRVIAPTIRGYGESVCSLSATAAAVRISDSNQSLLL